MGRFYIGIILGGDACVNCLRNRLARQNLKWRSEIYIAVVTNSSQYNLLSDGTPTVHGRSPDPVLLSSIRYSHGKMVNIVFLHPNIFNVLKYLLFSLTIGCLTDNVLDSFLCHSASRTLQEKGRYIPSRSRVPLLIRRNKKPVWSNGCHQSLIAAVFLAAALEMALDFSTGAQSIWTTTTGTFRISTQVSNVEQLTNATQDYISQVPHALQRVEGTCFHIYDKWYSPVSFNMSNSHEFLNLADAALCLQNKSVRVDATADIAQSSFRASDILATNIWNRSELMVGRDTTVEEHQIQYDQVGDVRIGALEKYSFVAANISDNDLIDGSETALTGNSSHESPWALFSAAYRTKSGKALECLISVNWKRDDDVGGRIRKDVVLQTCLVPISRNRRVLGLFDDVIDVRGERSLIMLVALDGVNTFQDLRVLKAIPFLMGRNNRMHTNRELAILTVLCSQMITAFSTDGLQDVRMNVDGASVTVPTWSAWGIMLFFISLVVMVVLKVVANRSRRRVNVKGNLVTAKGLAEHWLFREKLLEVFDDKTVRVVLVLESARNDECVTVGVKRADVFNDKRNSVVSLSCWP